MKKELQKKIDWFEQRHEEQSKIVNSLEKKRSLNRNSDSLKKLKEAKKEKLRLKDCMEWLKKTSSLK